MRSLMLHTVLAGLPQLPADYPMLDPDQMESTSTRAAPDLEEITVTKDGIFANTEAGAPMKPLDHIIHPNRHERRKAKALARRECRAIGADW